MASPIEIEYSDIMQRINNLDNERMSTQVREVTLRALRNKAVRLKKKLNLFGKTPIYRIKTDKGTMYMADPDLNINTALWALRDMDPSAQIIDFEELPTKEFIS